MTRRLLRNAILLDPEALSPTLGEVWIEDGRILEVVPSGAGQRSPGPDPGAVIDVGGRGLAPGFVDLHFHGEPVFARPAALPAALARTGASLLRHGTTAYLATTMAWEGERIREFVKAAREEIEEGAIDRARLIGVHLEGPWINPAAAGAQPAGSIRAFTRSDLDLISGERGRHVRMVTLAPEIAGSAELLAALGQRGIVAALGHSLADDAQIDAACAGGMTHVTHLFNAMGGMHHRRPGVAGHVLGEPRLSCDLICDGAHVHPRMLSFAARILGDRLVLITDNVAPDLEAPAGGGSSYGSGGVRHDGGALRLPDGRLAGSALTLDRALDNAQQMAGLSLLQAVAAASLRPARVLGLEAEHGTLRAGARADFAILAADGSVVETWLAGERVWSSQAM